LRYGDGVFETMKVVRGEIKLGNFHFDRLFNALILLQFSIPEHFSAAYLKEQILSLCARNNLVEVARIRLNVFRKNGGLYDPVDHTPDFVVETSELPGNSFQLNARGLIIDVYNPARKACDAFSNIKSNNYLPYSMGALHARKNQLDDCLILNSYGRISEATIANVFWIQGNFIFTPPLTEGCVAGVMRRHLLEILPQHGYSVQEQLLSISGLLEANELFLTNAVSGIRWVARFGNKLYTNTVSKTIYALLS
jgi:branched-chain amino acid aminotransferase